MRKRLIFGISATSLLCAAPAAAGQAPIIMMLPTFQKPLDKCYDPALPQKPELLADRLSRADVAIRNYLRVAATNTDVKAAYPGLVINGILIDGVEQPLHSFRDPWASRVARIEQIGFAMANLENYQFLAAWRAIAADGSTLGYYDAWLFRGPRGGAGFRVLKLTSATAEPPKISRYCRYAGDIEEFQSSKATREAKKAARTARN